ncbi:MAG: hypothetical protein KJ063_10720 [Anaerolineae bacterium]|nr:hypothetical protein [Anaerolineae bacterium]
MVVFAALKPHNPLPASQTQGYPPLVTSTPTPVSLSGYPGPPTAIPTSPAISFTVNYNHYIPIAVSNLPIKKGMVWNFYRSQTNSDPWNVMNIGWFHWYAPVPAYPRLLAVIDLTK